MRSSGIGIGSLTTFLKFRPDVLWSSEKGLALGDRNRAEFSGPGVYVLENMFCGYVSNDPRIGFS